MYARVTDGLTTDDEQVFKDLADDLEQDPAVEDAFYIKICYEDQVPSRLFWNSWKLKLSMNSNLC